MNIAIEDLEGRPHYVVPTVMIVEGVLHGAGGPILYPGEVLKNSVEQWNGKPVVVYHPDMHNNGYASNPKVFNKQKVGTLFEVYFAGRKLKAECWIDVERVALVDQRVKNTIVNKQMMEVSTGVVVEGICQKGEFGGRAYEVVAQNLRPDHLAILPDQIGACSIADGAGLVRNGWSEVLDYQSLLVPAMPEPYLAPSWS